MSNAIYEPRTIYFPRENILSHFSTQSDTQSILNKEWVVVSSQSGIDSAKNIPNTTQKYSLNILTHYKNHQLSLDDFIEFYDFCGRDLIKNVESKISWDAIYIATTRKNERIDSFKISRLDHHYKTYATLRNYFSDEKILGSKLLKSLLDRDAKDLSNVIAVWSTYIQRNFTIEQLQSVNPYDIADNKQLLFLRQSLKTIHNKIAYVNKFQIQNTEAKHLDNNTFLAQNLYTIYATSEKTLRDNIAQVTFNAEKQVSSYSGPIFFEPTVNLL